MRKFQFTFLAMLLVLAISAGNAVSADDYQTEPAETMDQSGDLFTAEELDDLLAPIALYPDPLLAQILPAATFIDQIDEAVRYLKQYGQAARIDDQPWDVSVLAIAHYPDVLFMMDQKYDWSLSLGQAYINQPQEVLDAIQRLRAEAREQGNLASTPQQEVIIEEEAIRIAPADPEFIYVPSYDPLVVYAYPPPAFGFITFGSGLTIGAWLNRDCDWHQHRIYYHGWRGSGWIDRSRRHVNTRRSVYIRNTYATINVNRRVMQHNTLRYREDVRRNVEYRREHRSAPAVPGRDIRPRGVTERRGAQPVTKTGTTRHTAAPVTGAPRTTPRPESTGSYRGREPRGARPPANTGYGGYGSGGEAKTYRERGKSSRQNIRKSNRQQSAPASSTRQGTSAGRQTAPAAAAPRQTSPAKRGDDRQQQ